VPAKHVERKKIIGKQKLPQTTREEGSGRHPSSMNTLESRFLPSEEKSPEKSPSKSSLF
jgi:hypothetical protein